MVKIILKSNRIIAQNTTPGELLGILLKNRQITQKNLDEFLHPVMPQPQSLADFISTNQLYKAAKRIQQAIDNQENILIYGDYDVDGISSTAVLYQSLLRAGAQVTPFIPNREQDGYGINSRSFFDLQDKNHTSYPLLITVDNGIVAAKEIAKITKKNTDVIIVDHHLPDKLKPPAFAVIHSLQFSGSLLAWILATQFDPQADLGLAILGLVSDCLSLTGLNRNFVIFGLKSLQQHPCLGIQHLIQVSGAKQSQLSVYDLGFLIGPRLNAIGRLSSPANALKLLTTTDPDEASKLAQSLDRYNQDRQSLQQESLDLAERQFNPSRDVARYVSTNKNKLLFAAHQSFNQGIIGLIASNLTEKYYLPSVIISLSPEVSKGSCRSIKELNIIEALRQYSHLFLDLGGHAGAAGFSLKTKLVPKLEKSLKKFISQKLSRLDLSPSVEVEAEMKLSAAKTANFHAIQKLQPFGIGNPEPLFLFKNVTISQHRLVGSTGNHLKLRLDDPSTPRRENIPTEAIAFKKGQLDGQLRVGDRVDIIARLDLNTWNNTSTPQLIVKEIILKS